MIFTPPDAMTSFGDPEYVTAIIGYSFTDL